MTPSGSVRTAVSVCAFPPLPYIAAIAALVSVLSLPGRSNRSESAPVAGPMETNATTVITNQAIPTGHLWLNTNREIAAIPN